MQIEYPRGLRDPRDNGGIFKLSEFGRFESFRLGWDWECDEPIATDIYRCESIDSAERLMQSVQRIWTMFFTDWSGFRFAIRIYSNEKSQPLKEISGTIGPIDRFQPPSPKPSVELKPNQ